MAMITAYAYDITVIVHSNEKINEISQIFEQFEAVSGAISPIVGMFIWKGHPNTSWKVGT
jgi:hypothetical protein